MLYLIDGTQALILIYWRLRVLCKLVAYKKYKNVTAHALYSVLAICLFDVAPNAKSCVNEIPEVECVARFRVHEINSITNHYLVKSLRPSKHEILGSSVMAYRMTKPFGTYGKTSVALTPLHIFLLSL